MVYAEFCAATREAKQNNMRVQQLTKLMVVAWILGCGRLQPKPVIVVNLSAYLRRKGELQKYHRDKSSFFPVGLPICRMELSRSSQKRREPTQRGGFLRSHSNILAFREAAAWERTFAGDGRPPNDKQLHCPQLKFWLQLSKVIWTSENKLTGNGRSCDKGIKFQSLCGAPGEGLLGHIPKGWQSCSRNASR
jgi:hypothetical protein